MTPLISVEKGHVEPEELAALVSLLLARAARPGPERRRHTARWRRTGFDDPRSWRTGPVREM